MKSHKKAIIFTIVFISAIFISVMGLYRSLTDVVVNPSPTGAYSIKMYWTDVGGWGWKGKVYLVKHGVFDKKYRTGVNVPASSEWVSDFEFELTFPSNNAVSGVETKKYSVDNFI